LGNFLYLLVGLPTRVVNWLLWEKSSLPIAFNTIIEI
jgi:hypothetical protein